MQKRYPPKGGDSTLNVWNLRKFNNIVVAGKGQHIRVCEKEGLRILDRALVKRACGPHTECSLCDSDMAILAATCLALYMKIQDFPLKFLERNGKVSSTRPPAPVFAIIHTLKKTLQDVVDLTVEDALEKGGEFVKAVVDVMSMSQEEAISKLKLLVGDADLQAAIPLPKNSNKKLVKVKEVVQRASARSTKGQKKTAYVDDENLMAMGKELLRKQNRNRENKQRREKSAFPPPQP